MQLFKAPLVHFDLVECENLLSCWLNKLAVEKNESLKLGIESAV